MAWICFELEWEADQAKMVRTLKDLEETRGLSSDKGAEKHEQRSLEESTRSLAKKWKASEEYSAEQLEMTQTYEETTRNPEDQAPRRKLRTKTTTGISTRSDQSCISDIREPEFARHSDSKKMPTLEEVRSELRTTACKVFQITHPALKKRSKKEITPAVSQPYHESGFVYAYSRRFNQDWETDYIKIGKTKNDVWDYLRREAKKCHAEFTILYVSPWIKHPRRVESMVHKELMAQKYELRDCRCNRTHHEWFKVDLATARRAIDRWSEWIAGGHYVGQKDGKLTIWTLKQSALAGLDNVISDVEKVSFRASENLPTRDPTDSEISSEEEEDLEYPSTNVPLATPPPSPQPLDTFRDLHAAPISDNKSDSTTPGPNPHRQPQTKTKAPVRPGPTALPTPPDSHSTIRTSDPDRDIEGPPPLCSLPTETNATVESDPFVTTTTAVAITTSSEATPKGTSVYIRVPIPPVLSYIWSSLSPWSTRFWSRSPSPATDLSTLVEG